MALVQMSLQLLPRRKVVGVTAVRTSHFRAINEPKPTVAIALYSLVAASYQNLSAFLNFIRDVLLSVTHILIDPSPHILFSAFFGTGFLLPLIKCYSSNAIPPVPSKIRLFVCMHIRPDIVVLCLPIHSSCVPSNI